jgi:leucyl-tRNA synthetase
MICVNELGDLKCNKREILEPLCVLLSPFAPHITEELWNLMGHEGSISFASFPQYDESVLVENTFKYPVSINGKMRANIELALDLSKEDVEAIVLQNAEVQKFIDGKPVKKVIFVPKKIVNIVV